jgi:hypothetical protein
MPRQTLYLWEFPSQVPGATNKKLTPVTVFLPDPVADGPSDPYVASILELTTAQGDCSQEMLVRQLPRAVETDSGRDFFPDLDGDDFAADFMHAFTAARLTLELVRAVVNSEMEWKGRWRWAWQQKHQTKATTVWSGDWEPSPLRIIAHAGAKLGASYYRSKRALLFFVSPVPELKAKLYSCRSMSMVVHETGHAILDSIDPSLYGYSANHVASTMSDDVRRTCDIIHEAFADACWMFTALGQPSWCAEVLTECGGQLRTPCRANQVGASTHAAAAATTATGSNTEEPATIQETQRSFLDPRTSWECGRGVYHCATVFVSFLWDSLVVTHDAALFSPKNAALNLHASATALCHMFVRAVCRCVRSWNEPSMATLVAEICNTDAAILVMNSAEFQSSLEDAALVRKDANASRFASVICSFASSAASARRIDSLGETRAKQRAGKFGDW